MLSSQPVHLLISACLLMCQTSFPPFYMLLLTSKSARSIVIRIHVIMPFCFQAHHLPSRQFFVDLAVFSSLHDAISNSTTIIILKRLSNEIHASGYHPLTPLLAETAWRSMVNYTNYDEYVNSRFRLVAMLNFSHYGIYSQLVIIACRAIQINFGFTISIQSKFMEIKYKFNNCD